MGVVLQSGEEFSQKERFLSMSKIVESACKLCRREGQKLFLKATRCYTDKCAYERRPYPPGQSGQKRLKFSEFSLQLREKQKVRRYYGVFESQFRKYYQKANRMKGDTGLNFLRQLEMRLDNVVYTLGYASSRREAKQLIRHNHFLVNKKRVNIPSFLLKVGDELEVREKSREQAKFLASIEAVQKREIPDWLLAEHKEFRGKVKDVPARNQITLSIAENMIIEFYSR